MSSDDQIEHHDTEYCLLSYPTYWVSNIDDDGQPFDNRDNWVCTERAKMDASQDGHVRVEDGADCRFCAPNTRYVDGFCVPGVIDAGQTNSWIATNTEMCGPVDSRPSKYAQSHDSKLMTDKGALTLRNTPIPECGGAQQECFNNFFERKTTDGFTADKFNDGSHPLIL